MNDQHSIAARKRILPGASMTKGKIYKERFQEMYKKVYLPVKYTTIPDGLSDTAD